MNDSEEVKEIFQFGETLYVYKGRKYSEESARHNGLIGIGAQLRHLVKQLEDSKS